MFRVVYAFVFENAVAMRRDCGGIVLCYAVLVLGADGKE